MQFIYTGEVNVTEEDLPDLLEVAEMLGVRGLKSWRQAVRHLAVRLEECNGISDANKERF